MELASLTKKSTPTKIETQDEFLKIGKDHLLIEELEAAKKDSRVKYCENIIDRFPLDNKEFIINPCHGDPSLRGILGGGFLTPEAFIKTSDLCHFTEYSFQKAGPRLQLALKPEEVNAAIVLGGALSPGLNVAIRELVMCLWFNYGVRTIWGIKFGLNGCLWEDDWIKLNPDEVITIHKKGGSILGSIRAPSEDREMIVEGLVKKNVNVLFCIGGIGTHIEMDKLNEIIKAKKYKISLAMIPKTIDNDIPLIDRSFGFESSVAEAVKVCSCANIEANSAPNGIGIVKIFGRECGFNALNATVSARDVNICLIPEMKFYLYGENGLLDFIFNRVQSRGHVLILVSEGVVYSLLDKNVGVDSKNDKDKKKKEYPDIGLILKDEITDYAKKNDVKINLKYIDPTYIIRSCPANSFDTDYSTKMAQNAVHSIFAGFTNFTSGFIETKPVIIPIQYIAKMGKRKVDLKGSDFRTMMASTGQATFNKQGAILTTPR